jgi:uncharacterized protein YsxB (DUF464 family)
MEGNIYDYGQQNFSLPHDIVQLPSGGVFYKSKKKAIKVGYLTANDENLLVNVIRKNSSNIVMNLLRTKIYEHDLKPEELTESDVEAVLLFLRNTSFGTDYNVIVKDPVTNQNFDAVVSLEAMNFKKTNVKPKEEGYFEVTLPKSGFSAKIKPLSYADTLELENLMEKYPKERTAPVITWRLNKHIVELNGITERSQVASLIDSLPIGDSKYIRNFLRENTPSLDFKKEVKAPSGELVTIDVTFGVEFFRPFFEL